MPLVLLIAAVGLIALLMFVGWRQRWDPTPQQLPPVTLKSARAAASGPPLPRWFVLVALAGYAVLPVSAILGVVLGRPWIAGVGLVLYGVSWALRLGGAAWVRARTPVERVAAVLRPAALFVGVVVAAITRSPWWAVGGAAAFLAAVSIASVDRNRQVRSTIELPPGSGDTRR